MCSGHIACFYQDVPNEESGYPMPKVVNHDWEVNDERPKGSEVLTWYHQVSIRVTKKVIYFTNATFKNHSIALLEVMAKGLPHHSHVSTPSFTCQDYSGSGFVNFKLFDSFS